MERTHLVLHAPNVHVGGGLVLLRELVSVQDLPVRWAHFDERIRNTLQMSQSVTRYYVRRSIFSRFFAEFRLRRNASDNDVVLCFHGLPPLFHFPGRVVVFIQNRILVQKGRTTGYPFRTKIRIWIERFLLRATHRNAYRYIVQTPSMAAALRRTLGNKIEICCLPFTASSTLFSYADRTMVGKKFDFVYVASGDAHKNHAVLFEAWRLLAEAGLRPSLALTVDPLTFPVVSEKIASFSREFGLNITNLGQLSPTDIFNLYRSTSALIYPSKTESLGLPLIEASQHGLPILAPEMDYVRDVVDPVQTFDPYSPVSITRAVKRFLGKPEPMLSMKTLDDFLAEVLK